MIETKVDIQYQVQEVLNLLPSFDAFWEAYKTVNGHQIGVHILVPKEKSTTRRPVLVRIHGGAWHEGSSDHDLRPWTLDLALQHKAVIVTPDYRLMPESQFNDIDDDLRDFWLWVENDLEKLPGLYLDASNVAIVGESAGGYLAAQSVLRGFSKKAAVVMLQYPALSIQRHMDTWAIAPADQIVPITVLDYYVAKMVPGKVLTRTPCGTRMDLAKASIQSRRLVDLSKYPQLDPITSLGTAERIPPIFLFHGVDDSSVPVGEVQEWAEKLKRLHPEVPLHAVFPPGEHVLDKHHRLEEPWLKEPIAFVERYWPVT
ncbi:putative Alpha/Beta hydrolase protein [Seiridium unicorne]|uniref:Alpha/Beta hydrolase protein n=1 Tax=Seiridium unicorne TaxID=138068 RepID=A0ABR2V804_9PEZI